MLSSTISYKVSPSQSVVRFLKTMLEWYHFSRRTCGHLRRWDKADHLAARGPELSRQFLCMLKSSFVEKITSSYTRIKFISIVIRSHNQISQHACLSFRYQYSVIDPSRTAWRAGFANNILFPRGNERAGQFFGQACLQLRCCSTFHLL